MEKKKVAGAKEDHRFSFVGGDKLAKMGASWFVSYAYYVNIDQSHRAWNQTTYRTRIASFTKTVQYHLYWLDQIGLMSDSKLATNRIGLMPAEVKAMAKKVLAKFW